MKLIRLLATLAMVVAGLAVVPTPATADRLVPERPLRLEDLGNACTVLNGTLRRAEDGVACDIPDGTILCAESCDYRAVALREMPPLMETCDTIRGTFRDNLAGQLACELKGGVVTVDCPFDEAYVPWWSRPEQLMVCNPVSFVPLDQPMS